METATWVALIRCLLLYMCDLHARCVLAHLGTKTRVYCEISLTTSSLAFCSKRKATGFTATRRADICHQQDFCTDVIVQSLQAWQSKWDEWVLVSNEANAACLQRDEVDVIRWMSLPHSPEQLKKKQGRWCAGCGFKHFLDSVRLEKWGRVLSQTQGCWKSLTQRNANWKSLFGSSPLCCDCSGRWAGLSSLFQLFCSVARLSPVDNNTR